MAGVTRASSRGRLGDLWGGAAAMLVALPAAIAFGVTIYSGLDAGRAAQGALAGMVGATALGLVAPALGGTRRLISAPCAPAAALLSAFALETAASGAAIDTVLLRVTVVGLLAGALQIAMGAIRLGRLIRYVPYPVVSGFLSGVGLIIITSQVPPLLGVPKGVSFWAALGDPGAWQPVAIAVGALTAGAMLGAGKLTRAVPAPILGLIAGVAGYLALGWWQPALLQLADNPFVIGPLGAGEGGVLEALAGRWQAIAALDAAGLGALAVPALTLAVLLSIDTLKTCVVLDALTRSHHDSNRELIGQGLGNIAAAGLGGIPGAGTIGATLVNLSSGGESRRSGVVAGLLSLAVLLVLAPLVAWIPVAALSGILIVIGCRMIEWRTLYFLRAPDTAVDFLVIAAVVAFALTVSLIAAAAAGIVLAVILFVREQIGGEIVRRQLGVDRMASMRVRSREEREILARDGAQATVFELQGSLFFGTAHRLQLALEPELQTRRYVILDLRRVQTADVTAGHVLDQAKQALAERGATLILAHLPRRLPSGRDVERYFDELGLMRPGGPVKVFDALDDALEWVEDRIVAAAGMRADEGPALALRDIEPFTGRSEDTFAALERCLEARTVKAGATIIATGETGDELFLIRRGRVRIMLPVGTQHLHVSTFGRGVFFGEMAFLDGERRSADALAVTDTELFVLSRREFDAFAAEHRVTAARLMEALATTLAARLRHTSAVLQALDS